MDRNHGSRSELPGEGVRIPRGGHDSRRPGVGSNNQLFVFRSKSDSAFLTVAEASLIRAEAFSVSVCIIIYIFAVRLNWNHLSVSQDIHLSLYCSVPPRKIMFCQTVLSVKKGKPGNKQSLNLRRAPCRRHACAVHRAVHRSGPAVVQRRPFFCLLKQNGCMHHATGAFTPRPRVLACSCFVSLRFPAPEQRHD